MEKIPTKVHGILDYLTGAAMVAVPLLMQRENKGAETAVPVALGAAVLVQSLLTKYELSPVKAIPMKAHLGLDIANGVALAASPWIFGFYRKSWIPYVAVGVMEVAVALMSETESPVEYDDAQDAAEKGSLGAERLIEMAEQVREREG